MTDCGASEVENKEILNHKFMAYYLIVAEPHWAYLDLDRYIRNVKCVQSWFYSSKLSGPSLISINTDIKKEKENS